MIRVSGSFTKDDLSNGIIEFYTGCQPADPNTDATGMFLGVCFAKEPYKDIPNVPQPLKLVSSDGNRFSNDLSQKWRVVWMKSGKVGWFRFRGKDKKTGFDGSVGDYASYAYIQMVDTNIKPNMPTTIHMFNVDTSTLKELH